MILLALVIFSLSGTTLTVAALLLSVHRARKKNKYSPFTEKFLRSPGYTLGKHVDELIGDVHAYFYLTVLPPPLAVVMYQGFASYPMRMAAIVIAIVCTVIGVMRLIAIFDEIQQSRLGLDGEVYTGQELNFLMHKGAWVFHDIPYQYGNIDHVVVSKGGIFTIETKAVRKPAGDDGKRQSKVRLEGDKLRFPHTVVSSPINQAKRHAKHVKQFLHKRTGNNYPVTAVVALPGWYVEADRNNDCLVINPKRGGGLRYLVEKEIIPIKDTEIIASHIEDFARTVQSGIDRNDPDAHEKYDFWLTRKHDEDKL